MTESATRRHSQHYPQLRFHAEKTAMELEDAANRALAEAGLLSRRNGVFTTIQLMRKMRVDRDRMAEMEEAGVSDEVVEYLVRRQVEELVGVSRLTAAQEICYRLYVMGYRVGDLAATLQINPKVASALLRSARRKVRAAISQGRYAGWYEVYLSEVRRAAYRSPRHARPVHR